MYDSRNEVRPPQPVGAPVAVILPPYPVLAAVKIAGHLNTVPPAEIHAERIIRHLMKQPADQHIGLPAIGHPRSPFS
ncbi:hypothetical protein D3C73_1311820 [compost metagenome]